MLRKVLPLAKGTHRLQKERRRRRRRTVVFFLEFLRVPRLPDVFHGGQGKGFGKDELFGLFLRHWYLEDVPDFGNGAPRLSESY